MNLVGWHGSLKQTYMSENKRHLKSESWSGGLMNLYFTHIGPTHVGNRQNRDVWTVEQLTASMAITVHFTNIIIHLYLGCPNLLLESQCPAEFGSQRICLEAFSNPEALDYQGCVSQK